MEPIILAKTDRWLVVDKPAGWLTLPGRDPKSKAPILLSWLKEKFGTVRVIHRIDRETSGIILFGLTDESHRLACSWFEKHQIRKFYDCLAMGRANLPTFRVSDPIAGKPATSQIQVKAQGKNGFLGRVRITTGRRHQIRIHLSEKKHPLWGDIAYGGSPIIQLSSGKTLLVDRVGLHSSRLELPEGEVFEAPWPQDFQSWVDQFLSEDGVQSRPSNAISKAAP